MSIIKHVTLQKIVAHDFRYDPRIRQQRMKAQMGVEVQLHAFLVSKLHEGDAEDRIKSVYPSHTSHSLNQLIYLLSQHCFCKL